MTKPVTLTGSVTKLEWQNPHIWVYLDVKADAGMQLAVRRRGAEHADAQRLEQGRR